ncbi:RING-box protein 1A-like Protein [Aphelenchoides bicaudatus]|nr:RING-box protein 1A-like Protein [Aphelenchoides bicaudatus]
METDKPAEQKMFTLKKWNAIAVWTWDVECDTCAICRIQLMETLSSLPSRFKKRRMRCCVGRMQSLLPSMLHVFVDQAEE